MSQALLATERKYNTDDRQTNGTDTTQKPTELLLQSLYPKSGGSQIQYRTSGQPANSVQLSTNTSYTLHTQTHRRGGRVNTNTEILTHLCFHTQNQDQVHFLSSYTLQLPPVNCELHRQKSPGAPCAEAAAEQGSVRQRNTTPAVKQGGHTCRR